MTFKYTACKKVLGFRIIWRRSAETQMTTVARIEARCFYSTVKLTRIFCCTQRSTYTYCELYLCLLYNIHILNIMGRSIRHLQLVRTLTYHDDTDMKLHLPIQIKLNIFNYYDVLLQKSQMPSNENHIKFYKKLTR